MNRRLRQLLIALALCVYALLLAELCVRLLAPQPLMPRYVTGTPWGVRGNIPGARYRHRTQEVNVGYRINSQGLRADREYAEHPVHGLCRVGMIGDSYFVGYEVEIQDTVAHQLELALESRGISTEVLNFSVSGFGTAEMLRTYEGRIRNFSPDLVIMQWHATDLDDNLRSGLYVIDGAGLRHGAKQYLPFVAMQDRLMRWALYRVVADNSQLYSFAREWVGALVKNLLVSENAGTPGDSAQPASLAPATDVREVLSARLLEESRKSVTSDGADFLVVDIPEPGDRLHLMSVWKRLPADEVQSVPVLHAADALESMLSAGKQIYYEKGHYHLTPLASTALATSIAERIVPSLLHGRCSERR
jgi:hypothetical protein